jgi:hypothetical protein
MQFRVPCFRQFDVGVRSFYVQRNPKKSYILIKPDFKKVVKVVKQLTTKMLAIFGDFLQHLIFKEFFCIFCLIM